MQKESPSLSTPDRFTFGTCRRFWIKLFSQTAQLKVFFELEPYGLMGFVQIKEPRFFALPGIFANRRRNQLKAGNHVLNVFVVNLLDNRQRFKIIKGATNTPYTYAPNNARNYLCR